MGSNDCHEDNGDVVGLAHRIITREIPTNLKIGTQEIQYSGKLNNKESLPMAELKETDTLPPISQDDLCSLDVTKESIHINENGHVEMPLPLRERPILPNSRTMAARRLDHLECRLTTTDQYAKDYNDYMSKVLSVAEAEEVPEDKTRNDVWYITHNGVYHPKKPDKIQVIFDCSVKSLNDHMLTGPDTPNAFVKGCANYGLKYVSTSSRNVYGSNAADFVIKNLYVNDELVSVYNASNAISSIRNTRNKCASKSLRLHKLIPYDRTVMNSIPQSERNDKTMNLDLAFDDLPIKQALGIQWCVESDVFQFRLTLKDQAMTRCGMLSTVASIYDPIGFLAPIILTGKQLLQEMYKEGKEWDDPLSNKLQQKWDRWRSDMSALANIKNKINQCFKHKVVTMELHHFSYASTTGIRQCSYQRLIDDQNKVVDILPGRDDLVRKVRLLLANAQTSDQPKKTYLERPVHKLILLLEGA